MFDRYNVEAIAALDAQYGLSKGGEIPWYIPEDFKWFKTVTRECVGIMGRGTYEDINHRLGEKAKESVLPGRRIYVLSSTMKPVENAIVVRSLEEIQQDLVMNEIAMQQRTIFFLGGTEVYRLGLPYCNRVYITQLYDTYGCDKFFPYDSLESGFKLTYSDDREDLHLAFQTYSRKM